MSPPLRILHLEDDPNDAELVRAALGAAGITCTIARAQDRDGFVSALEAGGIDLVLSDYTLPTFDGGSAAAIIRESYPAIPLILVSGTLGEERAVDALKNGATDFVLKGSLARLGPAVRRAMEQVGERAALRRAEAQIIEAQKIEAVGQLTGGIAHDFNNMMSVIIGYGDMIAADLPPDSPLREYTDEILLASQRAVALTSQLLVFSRKQEVSPAVFDINATVASMEKMLRRLIDENIQMSIERAEHVGPIKADAGYIGQVLMNLVINARDAMPKGGKLTVITRNIAAGDAAAQQPPGAKAGDYVMLSVTDTGSGMSDDIKAHVFEPFFTTKPRGKGTGLGLATCATIVRQSGGFITVDSKVGSGTTLSVFFPRVPEPIAVAAKRADAGSLPNGSETILVVEDEPSVARLSRSVLEAHGYHVLSALNGQDAIDVARENTGPPISLVLTDVVMPVMDGNVMADSLTIVFPDLKFLFTSGYSGDAVARHGIHNTAVEYLAKPYTTATLVLKVRELLDQEPAAAFATESA